MAYTCDLVERPTQPTLSIRTSSAVQDLPDVLGQSYGAISQYLAVLGESPAGAPFVGYYNMDMQDLDIEIGFPVSKELSGKGNIQTSEIQGGKFAATLHIGSYGEIESAYDALSRWMNENGHDSIGVSYEIYLNDPTRVQPNELQTKILFPLK
ncbi:MAG: AraC family transcriptional regulator [Anaerolineaceae bacterium 4572_78]|nr:MAG: AraC family transcriptional regulator [Anaerolineaceae bacterium 4572_78]